MALACVCLVTLVQIVVSVNALVFVMDTVFVTKDNATVVLAIGELLARLSSVPTIAATMVIVMPHARCVDAPQGSLGLTAASIITREFVLSCVAITGCV
jgi:hypothetical protein